MDQPADVAKLITLGRDREAAEHGARETGQRSNDTKGDHMDTLTQFGLVGPLLAGVAGNLSPDDLDRPTPCAGFTVRGVLEHMITGATSFAAAYRGESPPHVEPTDVLAGFGPAMTDLVAAITAPGALGRTIAAPFGEVDGDTFARFVVLDGLVHGWDLATATGQPYDPPADLVAAVRASAAQTVDALRDGDTFKTPVEAPTGSTPIEQLAAFTGRKLSEERTP